MTDFWGGPFTPDFIFNRLGPLKVLTWVSLVVESACCITVWYKPLRVPTVIIMVLFHIGIDLCMNMHCFEWLFILGWLVFLLEPAAEQKERVQKSNASSNNTSTSSCHRRILLNVFLFTIITIFTLDTLPMYEIQTLVPKQARRHVHKVRTLIGTAMTRSNVHSVINAVGLHQGPWLLYDGDPDEGNHYFQASINYENGTFLDWKSPDWSSMPWWTKKRYQRPMSFYEGVESDEDVQILLMQYLAREYGPHVLSVELIMLNELSPRPPPDLNWWWEPARREELIRSNTTLEPLNICDDIKNQCKKWAASGRCESTKKIHLYSMNMYCRKSCNRCANTDDIQVGSRIAVYWESGFLPGTIVEKRSKSRFLLDYGEDYSEEDGQYEWMDSTTLVQQMFYFLD